MYLLSALALLLLLFGVGVRQDRRRMRNAVVLGLAVLCALVGLSQRLAREPGTVASLADYTLLLLPVAGVAALALLLVGNGLTMVRREGRTLGNALSLLTGVLLATGLAVVWSALLTGETPLTSLAALTVLVGGYLSFLLLSFLAYALLYGRMPVRRRADVVVVLGAGLLHGREVGPLLASRLTKGWEVWAAQEEAGGEPVLLTSGGQGPDEEVPEARAMADWLVERGFPPGRLLTEERSRTTEENLRLSREVVDAERPGGFCLVVTNSFHVLRTALLARRTGLDAEVTGSPTASYYWPSAVLREFVAVLYQHKALNLGVCAVLTAPAVLVWFTG